MSRRPSLGWRVPAALIAVAAALVFAAPAEAQGVIGGQLLATGGTVDIVVQPATAVFTSRLFLLHPDGTRENIALSTEVGKRVTVGPFAAGQELVFGITVLNAGPTFFIGPARRNPDGIAHAEVTETGVRTFLVGFEDVFDGGDRDYDDNVFQFTGNLAPKASPRGRPNADYPQADSDPGDQRAAADDRRGPQPVTKCAPQAVRQAVHKPPRTSQEVLLPTVEREGALRSWLEHQPPSLFGQGNDVERPR